MLTGAQVQESGARGRRGPCCPTASRWRWNIRAHRHVMMPENKDERMKQALKIVSKRHLVREGLHEKVTGENLNDMREGGMSRGKSIPGRGEQGSPELKQNWCM